MKKTGFRLRTMLLAPLFLVAALLFLLLREPPGGAGKPQDRRSTAEAGHFQERPGGLEPKVNDQEPPGRMPASKHHVAGAATTAPDSPAGNDTTTSDEATERMDHAETTAAEPYVGAASFRCVVPDGGAMLTGGWTTPNGGRTFALISPKPTPDAAGPGVTVSSMFFELPEEQLTGPTLNALLESSDEGRNFRGTSLDSDEVTAFRKAYASKMSRIMSSPRVSMAAGEYASIQVAGASDGVMLAVIAEQAADGSGIDLNVSVVEHSGIDLNKDEEKRQ